MTTQPIRRRVAAGAAAFVAVAVVSAGCSSGSSSGSGTSPTAASTAGTANAQAEVDKFAANPALDISPLPSRPKTSTYAIQLNCTIPACGAGAMKPAMAALGWRFDEMPFDVAKGPSAVQQALTRAIAAKPNVIFIPANYPASIFQSQVNTAVRQGIKFVGIGGTELAPGWSACIQCTASAQALGALAADIALADAGGKIDIAVATDKTITSLVNEQDGVKKEVAKIGNGSRVLELQQSITATPANNAARTVSFLQRNPSVKYLLLTSPQFQAAASLNSAGLGHRVKIVGMYPYSPAEVASVKDGQVLAYAVGEFQSLYWRAADAAARAVAGVELEPSLPIQSMRVMNKSNADVSLLDPANYQDIFKKAWNLP